MSKFFQSKTYTEIDDNNYSYNTTWSSNRVVTEIENYKPKLKIGELADVVAVHPNDNDVISYSKGLDKWVSIPLKNIGGGGITINQVTKLGVDGTLEKPEIIKIPQTTTDFKVFPPTMFKYKNLQNDLIVVESEFISTETADFQLGDYIIFDGKAKLKIDYGKQMDFDKDLAEGREWTYPINKAPFKKFKDFKLIRDTYPILKYKALPKDQILVQKKDYNLENVCHLDYFYLNAVGKNIRILCSDDSGTTWKRFNGTKFEKVDALTIDTLKEKGNTIEEFNVIKERWNYVISGKKIRFAYLLSMDDFDDEEYIESLVMQYDGNGVWMKAKDSEYDVEMSNTEITIYCYISGDIKINY